jgi:carboxymethylenebutenolidase
MNEKWIELATHDGPMNAFLVKPDQRPSAAMVVVQEAFGVNGHIQNICRRLAREGYVAIAPELFHREGQGLVFGYDEFPKLRPIFAKMTNESILTDVGAALDALRASPDVDPTRVGVIGFCVGGLAALLAATRLDVRTAVAFYGGGVVHHRPGIALSPFVDDLKKVRAPVLALYGEADHGIPPADVQAVRAALGASGGAHEVVTYPGADHGFFCDERQSYHPQAAADAWSRVKDWLARVLR